MALMTMIIQLVRQAKLSVGIFTLLLCASLHASDAAPDLELLEFLGEGVEVENEYMDPLAFYEMQLELDEMKNTQDKQEKVVNE